MLDRTQPNPLNVSAVQPTVLKTRLFRDRQWVWSGSRGTNFVLVRGAVEVIACDQSDVSLLVSIVDQRVRFRCDAHPRMELRLRALGLVTGYEEKVGEETREENWQPSVNQMIDLAHYASLKAEMRIERLFDLYLRGQSEGMLPRRTQADVAVACGLTLRTVTRTFGELQRQGRLALITGKGWSYKR